LLAFQPVDSLLVGGGDVSQLVNEVVRLAHQGGEVADIRGDELYGLG